MKSKIKKVLMVMGVFLFLTGTVWGLPIMEDDTVVMTPGEYREPGFSGGEFTMTVYSSGSLVGAYVAFCVEKDEYINIYNDNKYTVDTVAEYATNGGKDDDNPNDGKDYLSEESKWLYASYISGNMSDKWGSRSASLATQVQMAFWYLEDETDNVEASDAWHALIDGYTGDFTSTGWDIQVVNILDSAGNHAQSQIVGVHVPEPSTMLLLGTGLIGVAGIGRRKLKK